MESQTFTGNASYKSPKQYQTSNTDQGFPATPQNGGATGKAVSRHAGTPRPHKIGGHTGKQRHKNVKTGRRMGRMA